MKKPLRKQVSGLAKNYAVLQSKCSCGPCGCICACTLTLDDATMDLFGTGNESGNYNTNYTAHS